MSWWDDLGTAVSGAVNSTINGVGTEASRFGNWVGSGVANPGQAVQDTWTQLNQIPTILDARAHGFESVEAYQAYIDKNKGTTNDPYQNSPKNGLTDFINSGPVGGAVGAVLGNGVNVGVGIGAGSPTGVTVNGGMPNATGNIPKTPQQAGEALAQAIQAYNNPSSSGLSEAQLTGMINKAANDYKELMGPASVNFQMPNIPGLSYSNSLGYTPINVTNATNWNTADGNPNQLKMVTKYDEHGQPYQTWESTDQSNNVGLTQNNVSAPPARPGDHRPNPVTGVNQTYTMDGQWRDGNNAGSTNTYGPPQPNPVGPAVPYGTPQQTLAQAQAAWQKAMDDITYKYEHDMSFTPDQEYAAMDKLGPQPNSSNWTAPPAAPVGSATTPTPEVSTNTQNPLVSIGTPQAPQTATGNPAPPLVSAQNPAPSTTGTTGAAAGAVGAAGAADAGVLAALKGLGIDANTAAILASGLGSGLTTYLASKAQTDAAKEANTAQQTQLQKALDQQNAQFNTTNEINKGIYDTQQANLKPWLDAGTAALPKLQTQIDSYDPASFSTGTNWQDPGYHFRLDEGMKALQSSAAAKGGLLSGNTLRGITDYAQGAASQEYNNAFNRYQTTFGTKTNALQSLAGIGQTATTQTNAAGSSYGNAAQQAGQNNSNALSGILTGSGNAAANANTAIGNANATGYVTGASILNNMMNQYFANQSAQSQNALTAAMTGSK